MAGNVLEFTDATFDTAVLQSSEPVLVDFWAPWCGPCRQIAPHVEALANEFTGKLKVGKMNVDDNATPARYHVMSIPTLLLFKGGKVAAQVTGYEGKDALRRVLTPHLP